eukprot:5680965-Alexandrium_andersonii.AAC.1
MSSIVPAPIQGCLGFGPVSMSVSAAESFMASIMHSCHSSTVAPLSVRSSRASFSFLLYSSFASSLACFILGCGVFLAAGAASLTESSQIRG